MLIISFGLYSGFSGPCIIRGRVTAISGHYGALFMHRSTVCALWYTPFSCILALWHIGHWHKDAADQ